ncbi:phosphomannomutase / phosphoglucomutase [Methanobrevibacter gottschalkii]|uniref:Phosphomannomutase/phosphoglucomutase n=2 Tax=Methanobrevibacter gottschalkii TaxID=190974 RepID=A0A3N5B6Z2_9EURY|nr:MULTISPECIES: phosphoglucosamine mutase [Methanobrevibacter]MCQ2971380.1 phosphoglucosamine mutase [archaeon]OEC97842.1 phosphoglucosamine mutase [Methanobrevibacter sp. A27]RPF53067.1 phosphomannomutase/phosphoglucomutase [Methanobrevibacter gottschalkii DSM 11977]SEK56320.1 phosphomannomutase / phosphoglucomutase [Methanobrevibacter gottschalkii]
MSNKKRLFGTFGVRRTANDVLTPEFATRLSACYGSVVKGKIAVGADTRTTSPMLKDAVIAGLLSAGCDAVDLGTLPTPAVQYAVRQYYDGGIMITASHNPPEFNGLKFLDEFGIGLPDDIELEIESLYFDSEPIRANWDEIGEKYTNDNIIDEYIQTAMSHVDVDAIKEANLKVVLDCGSGAGSFTAPYLVRELGCEVTTLNCQADGFFPGRDPEPIEENLQELISVVKELNADIGLAHDGDADRTICIDENGAFVLGDKTFTLVEKQMLKENGGGTIVTTVATSQAIYDIAEEYNGEVIATAVGDLLVARKLKDTDGLFGGEENGGLIFPNFVYGRDAALTVAKILEIIAKENKTLSQLVSELPVYYSAKMKTECSDDLKEEIMSKIAAEVKETTDYELDTTDGVKIFKDGGWVIIRPSGTEPIFRSYSEGNSQEQADEMAQWGISLIKKYRD